MLKSGIPASRAAKGFSACLPPPTETIVNRWNHTSILPAADPLTTGVSVDDKVTRVLDELKQLLLDFGSATTGRTKIYVYSDLDLCSVKEFISIQAEEWTDSPESDDEESSLAIALAESDEPTAADACDDGSVEVQVMSWKEAKAASAALRPFLEENKCASREAMKEVSTELSRMTFTTRTSQSSLTSFFQSSGPPVGRLVFSKYLVAVKLQRLVLVNHAL